MARLDRKSRQNSAAAYTLIDISSLDDDLRKDIIEDANAGGGLYGVRVVEESVHGGARAPIYGVYKGEDADRWTEAKKELGITGSKIDDGDVTGTSGDITDPRREAALREAAAQRVEAEAARIRAGEASELEAITGEADESLRTTSGATDHHATNIVDTTLDSEATNEAADAEGQEPTKASKSKKTK